MREKEIEQKLVAEAKRNGMLPLKFVSPGFDGMPDRMVLLGNGELIFIEVKAPGKKPRPLQISRHKLLRSYGFKVYVLDDKDQIEKILKGDKK